MDLILSLICPEFDTFWPSTENTHDPFIVEIAQVK